MPLRTETGMKTHGSVCFYAGYFYAQMLMFQKDYKGYKGYGIKIMAYSLERLLFVSSTPRRIFTCGRQCLCCNGYSAVSGAEKAGDSSEDPQTGKEKQIYV